MCYIYLNFEMSKVDYQKKETNKTKEMWEKIVICQNSIQNKTYFECYISRNILTENTLHTIYIYGNPGLYGF